jgi:hypothetical protein
MTEYYFIDGCSISVIRMNCHCMVLLDWLRGDTEPEVRYFALSMRVSQNSHILRVPTKGLVTSLVYRNLCKY